MRISKSLSTVKAAADIAPASVSRTAAHSVFDRLALIRFPLIVLVVFYHNEAGGEFTRILQGAPVFSFIVDLIANGFAGIRVPTFFLIAGFVFFTNFRPTVGWFRVKISSRARSLLIPLVLWSALWMLIFAVVQRVPATASFLSGKSVWSAPIADFSLLRIAQALLGPSSQLFLYHLWFLRDLFILVLFTPVIYFLIKATRGWITFVLLIAWAAGVANNLVSSDGLLFFVVGCQLAVSGTSVFFTDRLGPYAIACWIVLKALDPISSPWLFKPWVLCGVVVVFYLSGWLSRAPAISGFLTRAARYSFFVFVAHEPLLTIVRRLYFKAWAPQTPSDLFAAYFGVVLLTLILLLAFFKLAERLAPSILHVMTGGRT